MSRVSLNDPKFADRYRPTPLDPAEFLHEWICGGEADTGGDPFASFFHVENSYWAARRDENMLLVHFNDLKQDRAGEMRRIAEYLDIEIPESLWPKLIEAASFETMKAQGDALIPMAERIWEGGARTFLNKGTNGRWQDVAAKEDLALYDAKVQAAFLPALAQWIEHGRLIAGDPRKAPD